MKSTLRHSFFVLLVLLVGICLSSSGEREKAASKALQFPHKKAGLTERQAAAHLLSRFTFGARPGQVDEVVKMGLEKWFMQQLQTTLPDQELEQKLAGFASLQMTNEQIAHAYASNSQILRLAIDEGIITKEEARNNIPDKESRLAYKARLSAFMKEKGFHAEGQLTKELINQKILRATYTQNQLQEVLTSFWFNHFNVSLYNRNCARYILSYERDVIRPNVLGKFEAILLATAKSPAMLAYLDNYKSAAAPTALTPAQKEAQKRQLQALNAQEGQDSTWRQVVEKIKNVRKNQGLNENYAREIMELHTLGVDGGYTQQDVTQAARILTGWTINPTLDQYKVTRFQPASPARARALAYQGFVLDGDFLFAANRHDQGEKVVLGTTFPAGGGYEEGLRLIKLLAQHPSTARFISTKLATRFVHDTPPQSLVDKMAKTFKEKEGDIQQVLVTMVSAPEFWSKEALREKTKSPFELAISSVRSLNAEVQEPYQLYNWIAKMGEQMYRYQAPTGFPDRGTYWINTGSLLNRMNFGLALAAQKIKGISFDLMALNQHREPESAEAALLTYSQHLLPERDLEQTIRRLTPTLYDPGFSQKVGVAASKVQQPAQAETSEPEEETMMMGQQEAKPAKPSKPQRTASAAKPTAAPSGKDNAPMLAQVVGIIIGSPEFQRR
ncbi:DUF1800 domain-containing protein [Rufibacter psychrotolerans]|uniref:DUF1800 domain-containing protein n=1 Tax=Rufibacter psychrotolerans TaxID=2812556 RepID=UPI001967F766|nr:DUF1800 domain-containing protein [Rufibacter sp. SYSU D00308]